MLESHLLKKCKFHLPDKAVRCMSRYSSLTLILLFVFIPAKQFLCSPELTTKVRPSDTTVGVWPQAYVIDIATVCLHYMEHCDACGINSKIQWSWRDDPGFRLALGGEVGQASSSWLSLDVPLFSVILCLHSFAFLVYRHWKLQ